MPADHKVIVVTPAGRRRYLELLQHYILADTSVFEWHLWDNCRSEDDRSYINKLAFTHEKIKVVRAEGVDGTNRSVNGFYRFCKDPSAFYIKLDDDIVYLPKDFGISLYRSAFHEKGKYLWWSPLVINNAVCSWLLKYHSRILITDQLSCQASHPVGWADYKFAEWLHRRFLQDLNQHNTTDFTVDDFVVSLSRFSINCLGMFGSDIRDIGERFCPVDVDDEEWISAYLPSRLNLPGRVVGSLLISHFSFNTQEPELLKANLLEEYYRFAGVQPPPYTRPVRPLRQRVTRSIRHWKRAVFD